MGRIPKRGLFLLLGASLFFLSCGEDQERYIRAVEFSVPMGTTYGPAASYVVPRYIPIVPRSAPYRYIAEHHSFSRWHARHPLGLYLDCRASGAFQTGWGLTRCGFPYRYRVYATAAELLDRAMEELWLGHRGRAYRYLELALGGLPVDDPIAKRIEKILKDAGASDDEELEEATMDALGDAASKMTG